MWSLLQGIGDQVSFYTTGLGQIWYILVFGFRLVIVSTIGGSVYGDEQSQFNCNEKMVGCRQMCYNQFAKISHIRFWAFQIIAVSTPTIFFHLYVTYVSSQIQKVENAKTLLEQESFSNGKVSNEIERNKKRQQKLGDYKMKERVRGKNKLIIPQSRKILIANFINLFIRLAIEMIFIFLTAHLFNIKDNESKPVSSFTEFFWMSLPGHYLCRDDDDEVKTACYQAMLDNNYVSCWISRPSEKTIMLRYMNIISVMCVLVTLYDIFAISFRAFKHRNPAVVPSSESSSELFNSTTYIPGSYIKSNLKASDENKHQAPRYSIVNSSEFILINDERKLRKGS